MLPEGWEEVKLADVCRFLNGRAYSKDELLSSGKYPVLRVGNFFTNEKWYFSNLELEKDKYCDNGDLLYAWSASFAPKIWSGGIAIYHYHIWKIESAPDFIDRDFLYYFLEWDVQNIKLSEGSGSTMIHITKGAIERRTLNRPPISEQRRIAEVLRAVDETVSLAKQTARAIRVTFNRLIDDLHRLYEDNSLPLAEFCVSKGLQTGPFGSQLRVSDYVDAGIPVVMPSDLRPNGIDFSGAKSTSLHKASQLPQHQLRAGDILFSRRGDVEKCGLYLEGDPEALCGTGCLRARIDADKADPVLIYFLAQSARCGSWLTQHAVGVTMPNLNTSIVGALPIPNLPMAEQKKWTEALLLAEGACRVNETYVAEAQKLKLALSSDLLTGRVRVPA